MSVYRKFRRHFSNGVFIGKGPLAHFHVLKGEGAVALLFNDKENAVCITAEIHIVELGMESIPTTVETIFGKEVTWSISKGYVSLEAFLEGYYVSVMLIK